MLAAIAAARLERSDEIRPLRLVDLQPCEAIERTRAVARRVKPANISASPLDGVGGLSLAVFVLLMTSVLPALWWSFAAAIVGGSVLGAVLIARRRRVVG